MSFLNYIIGTFSACVLIDSIISVGCFVREWMNASGNTESAVQVIQKYDDLYKLKSFERYFLYGISSAIPLNFPIAYILTVPYCSNTFADIPYISRIVQRSRRASITFAKYIGSKMIIKGINSLHRGIIPIKNYNIFPLAHVLGEMHIINVTIKTFIYTMFLNYLRAYSSTYMYYKAIKLSQYYQTGHYFVKNSVGDAVNIVNEFVDKKDWRGLADISVVNALYTLIVYKLGQKRTVMNLRLHLYTFYALWNFIYILQCVSWYIVGVCFVVHMSVYFTWRTLLLWSILTSCLWIQESIVICSIMVALTDIWAFLLKEVYFFVCNVSDIQFLMKIDDVQEFEIVD